MSTFSPLDLIESDMWRWDVLSVSISIPFILMFLTYNCCAKWPLRIVRTFQTCAKRLVQKVFCVKCPVFLAFHNREQIKIHVIVLILRTACKCCFIFLVIGFLFLFLLLFFFFLFYNPLQESNILEPVTSSLPWQCFHFFVVFFKNFAYHRTHNTFLFSLRIKDWHNLCIILMT